MLCSVMKKMIQRYMQASMVSECKNLHEGRNSRILQVKDLPDLCYLDSCAQGLRVTSSCHLLQIAPKVAEGSFMAAGREMLQRL